MLSRIQAMKKTWLSYCNDYIVYIHFIVFLYSSYGNSFYGCHDVDYCALQENTEERFVLSKSQLIIDRKIIMIIISLMCMCYHREIFYSLIREIVMSSGENTPDMTKILQLQQSLSNFTKDLTIFFTQEHLSNSLVLSNYLDRDIKDLIKEQSVSVFGELVNSDGSQNQTLKEILCCLEENCLDFCNDENYKRRYTQQLVIGMARLEWVPANIIDKVYWKNIQINKDMQEVFRNNNLTLMDLTSRDVILWQKEKQLFLYTMLFLHDWENKNTDNARESWYYKVKEWEIEIKEYGVKSFEQAFNCGWQMYNDFFWNKEEKKIFHIIPLIL